jgi:hypothetical protein
MGTGTNNFVEDIDNVFDLLNEVLRIACGLGVS